jgi:hypothetical protein
MLRADESIHLYQFLLKQALGQQQSPRQNHPMNRQALA